jgi:hypothetical protein
MSENHNQQFIGRDVTRSEIATRLRALADDMEGIAVDMDYFGGFAEWARHSKEMLGAAWIARQWADSIEGRTE